MRVASEGAVAGREGATPVLRRSARRSIRGKFRKRRRTNPCQRSECRISYKRSSAGDRHYTSPLMGATASLEERVASVQPGSEVVLKLRVENSGHVVDQFDLVVL